MRMDAQKYPGNPGLVLQDFPRDSRTFSIVQNVKRKYLKNYLETSRIL